MKRNWLIPLIIVFAIILISIPVYAGAPGDPPGLEKALVAQEKHNPELLGKPGIVGTAVGLDDGIPVVQVFTEKPGVGGIPALLEGIPVKVEVTGKIMAIGPAAKGKPPANNVDSTAYFARPVPIGISTGNTGECSAGTIGARVIDIAGNVYALSNNHVYALEGYAAIGSEVLQPGRYDTGCAYQSNNVIGTLFDYESISFVGANAIDAAIAKIALMTDGRPMLAKATPSNGYGTPGSVPKAAVINMAVQKYGRTSQLTKGTVTSINGAIYVSYSGGTALFTDQIIVQSRTAFIKAGDSGSLLVTYPGKQPVGLLFAGDTSGKFAVANDIGAVLAAFGVTIDGE